MASFRHRFSAVAICVWRLTMGAPAFAQAVVVGDNYFRLDRNSAAPIFGEFQALPSQEGDYYREPRAAKEGERCVRVIRHVFSPVSDRPEDFENFAERLEHRKLRFRRRADSSVVVYTPIPANGPTAGDLALGGWRFDARGYVYRGWDYAAVSGCR